MTVAAGERLTISVVEAGRRLGVGKNAAYDAARRGEIPVLRIGRRMVVPIAAFEAMLAVQSKLLVTATELVTRMRRDDAGARDHDTVRVPGGAEPVKKQGGHQVTRRYRQRLGRERSPKERSIIE